MKYYYKSFGYPTQAIANEIALELGHIKGVYFNVFKVFGKYYFDNTYDSTYQKRVDLFSSTTITAHRGVS